MEIISEAIIAAADRNEMYEENNLAPGKFKESRYLKI
jgi:hypothetical protein